MVKRTGYLEGIGGGGRDGRSPCELLQTKDLIETN